MSAKLHISRSLAKKNGDDCGISIVFILDKNFAFP